MRSLLLFTFLLCSWNVNAETWISSSFWSYHIDREGDKNEQNFGIGVEHVLSDKYRIAAGIYKNSNRIDSGYLVGVACVYKNSGWCFGGMLGGVTGYERYAIGMAGGVLSYEGKTWGLNLVGFPKDGGVFAIQLKRRFW